MPFQAEYAFTLPNGYVDSDGNLHRDGVMRLATAADEIIPMRDPRVQQNPSYLTILVLSRVIVRLGSIAQICPELVEGFFPRDLAFLNDMYERLNGIKDTSIEMVCPKCGCHYSVSVDFTQGS